MGGISLLAGGFEVDAGSSLICVPFRIIMRGSRIILQDGTKKEFWDFTCPAGGQESQAGRATCGARRAQTARSAARLSARGGTGARARRVLEGRICRNFARRSVGRDRHEPAEPL